MPRMIDHVSAPDLLASLDTNMIAYWLPYGRAATSRFAADDTVAWFYTGVPHPLFNGVMGAALKAEAIAPLVATLGAFITQGGAPLLWWVGPLAEPADLGTRLARLGLQPAGEAPAMAIELARLPEAPEAVADFIVRPVDGAEAQALWARIAARGSEFPAPAVDALEALERTLADQGYRAQRRYVGFLDGVPVATSALVLEAGVAGIYAVATIPEARGKGVGRLMTLKPLIEARAIGYRVGILQASSMGHPIYEKIGFADVGTYRLYLQAG